jgi:hypothetical protein
MKKMLGIFTALTPAFSILTLVMLFQVDAKDGLTIISILATIVLTLIICKVYASFRHKAEILFLAKMNLWIIGSNLLVFLAQIVIMIIVIIDVRIAEQQGAMEGGLMIVLYYFLFLPSRINYLICRITAALCARNALDETLYSHRKGIHSILHLFPIADMISAIWVYRKVKHCQTFQQPTIETD